MVLGTQLQAALLEQGAGPGDLQHPLLTSALLQSAPTPTHPLTHRNAGHLQVFVEEAGVVHLSLRDTTAWSQHSSPTSSSRPWRPQPAALT